LYQLLLRVALNAPSNINVMLLGSSSFTECIHAVAYKHTHRLHSHTYTHMGNRPAYDCTLLH